MPEELPEISKSTSFSLNIVRILAMIGVVNLHTILVFVQRPDMFHARLWLPLETFLTLSMPAVSLFFILSG
jgi:surface polysaccharide O-acyltransferase-like enzyme